MQGFHDGLKFVQLYLSSKVMTAFVDAGFGINPEMSSQIGFLVALIGKENRVNNVHHGSLKSKLVTRPFLASEFFSIIQGLDISSTLRLVLNDILGRLILLHVYKDSKSTVQLIGDL